jgi:adenosylhomocysteine nucleosidase
MKPTADYAFVCAMPMELDPLVRRLNLTSDGTENPELHRGALGGRSVAAVVTGMGTELATAGVSSLLERVDVGHVIVVGITGAIDNDTPIGTIVRPATVTNGATGKQFYPDHLGTDAPAGTMWTTDTLITDPEEVTRLRASGVVSLDMETAAVGQVCEASGIPWSVVRVISDRATDGSVDEEVFHLSNQDGTPNEEAIARFFEEHPERLEAMAKLAEGAVQATETAAAEAIRICGAT